MDEELELVELLEEVYVSDEEDVNDEEEDNIIEEPDEDPSIPDYDQDSGEETDQTPEEIELGDTVEPDEDDIIDEVEEEDIEEPATTAQEEEVTPVISNTETLPAIGHINAGDRVMVALVGGEATVIGTVGSGDTQQGEIYNAAKTATNYITADTSGITIHNADDLTNYHRLTANGTDLVANNVSVASFLSNGARIGKASAPHIILDSDGMELFNGSTSLAEFGEDVRIGRTNDTHVEISNDYAAFKDGDGNSVFDMNMGTTTITTRSGESTKPSIYFTSPGMHTSSNFTSGIWINPSSDFDTGNYLKWTNGFDMDIAVKDMFSITRDDSTALNLNQYGFDFSKPITCLGINANDTCYIYDHSLGTTTDDIDYDTTLSADAGGTGLYFKDDYGNNFGYVRSFGRSGADLKRGVQIGGHNPVNSNIWNFLYLLTDDDGNRFVQFSERAPWLTALGLDVAETTLTAASGAASVGTTCARRYGKVVTIEFLTLKLASSLANGTTSPTLLTIPSGYRPSWNVYFGPVAHTANLGSSYYRIDSSGNLTVRNQSGSAFTTSYTMAGTVTYVIA